MIESAQLPPGSDTWLDAAVQTLCGFHPTLKQSAEGGHLARRELECGRTEHREVLELFMEWHEVHCEDHCSCPDEGGGICLQCRSAAVWNRERQRRGIS